MWNELTFLWNELTILWNDLTIDWNDLTWNDLTMERNDHKSSMESPCISCREIAYLTIYRSHIGNCAKPSLVLSYNRWIRQDPSQANLND